MSSRPYYFITNAPVKVHLRVDVAASLYQATVAESPCAQIIGFSTIQPSREMVSRTIRAELVKHGYSTLRVEVVDVI